MFDVIYMFEGGQLLAAGSLEQLLLGCEPFRVQWERYRKTGAFPSVRPDVMLALVVCC